MSSRSPRRSWRASLEREKPDALLPTMGGQTALQLRHGTVRRRHAEASLGIELIGADRDVIAKAEDRQLFREAKWNRIGLESPRSRVVHSLGGSVWRRSRPPALPSIIRPSVHPGRHRRRHRLQPAEFERDRSGPGPPRQPGPRGADRGSRCSAGRNTRWRWVRDRADNCIIICSIENIDPMGHPHRRTSRHGGARR